MSESKIEWTERTWNPIVGCSILTPGCTNCYAMKMAARLEVMGNTSHYAGTTKKVKGNAVWTGKWSLASAETLLEPIGRKKPTTYFVNSMGDLLFESIPDLKIDQVMAVMAVTPQHTYQILTKRAGRMRAYMTTPNRKRIIAEQVMNISNLLARQGGHEARIKLDHFSACFAGSGPFKNIWLGVSTERQQEADERIPHLLQTPAAVRFISAEPLLGPIDLMEVIPNPIIYNAVHGMERLLDWVIVGGESGPNARPMHPDWARTLRDQCVATGVDYFFKQWGEWQPHKPVAGGDLGGDVRAGRVQIVHPSGRDGCEILTESGNTRQTERGSRYMARVGKKSAGRLLDGIEHNGMPSKVTACS